MTQRITAAQLISRYDTFWVDAYGVLVDGQGALPHATRFWEALGAPGKQRLLVSNDASRSPTTVAHRFQGLGFTMDPAEILTSGDLIADYFAERQLGGAPCIVLGTADSRDFVTRAGGEVVEPAAAAAAVVVAADDAGFDFLPAVEATLSSILRALEAGDPVELILPNPDVIYPKAGGQFGFTAGAVAMLLEEALRIRLGPNAPTFVRLGKPHRRIFEAAARRTGVGDSERGRTVMVGDQLPTDIRGALDFGVAAALVETGLSRLEDAQPGRDAPTLVLANLQ